MSRRSYYCSYASVLDRLATHKTLFFTEKPRAQRSSSVIGWLLQSTLGAEGSAELGSGA